uniref:Uncharacterized protein n=1 Tax=Knipowitschia caucasica TaxID=637954 RepID=A0AAV2K8L1_KNICA
MSEMEHKYYEDQKTERQMFCSKDVAAEHLDEVKKLIALVQPHLKNVLARQRRDYGIDEETFPMDYPVSEQAGDIDGTPVHNIGMERQCGKVDYRLKKLEDGGSSPGKTRGLTQLE